MTLTDRKMVSKSLQFSSAILFIAIYCVVQTHGFSSLQSTIAAKRHLSKPKGLFIGSYGRGAEIWPECNEDPVQLADSFPNGEVPYSAIVEFENQDMAAVHKTIDKAIMHDNAAEPAKRRSKRKIVSKSIKRILRRAAAKEELDSEAETRTDRTPIIVALALLFRGLVRPLDVLLVTFLTSYFTILGMVARSPRESTGAPIMPSMPPQGHVPTIVSNPLGMGILNSKSYDLWLKLGVVVGLVGPFLLLSNYLFLEKDIQAARVCARPIFMLCCQAISEAVSRRLMVSSILNITAIRMFGR